MSSLSDSFGSGNTPQVDISSLSDTEKRELQQFITNESQKASVQENIHNLTSMCFKKCITGRISGAQLDRTEEPCMQNCVLRFLDVSHLTVRHLEKMRQS